VAIIVSPDNPLTNITHDQLRQLYLGRSTEFPNRDRVVLLELAPLRGIFYRSVLGMSEDQVKRYWISVIFAGGAAEPPKEFGTADAIKRYVARHVGAVAFIAAPDVDSTVKALTVDGHPAADPDYPIHSVSMTPDGRDAETACRTVAPPGRGC
jgi:hypothetical protein